LIVDVHSLTGPAHEAIVPRETFFDLTAEQRSDKPLWAWDEAFDAIGALEDAGAAVVQGEIVAVSESGEVSQVPWEPWMEGAPLPEYPPSTRRWYCRREENEPWSGFTARAAAYARSRARDLAGEARTTPAGALHLDLSWAMEDELTLFDVPGWVRPVRRRLIERAGTAREWWGLPSFRMRCVGPPAPGSYYGAVSDDVSEIPEDARYARLRPRAEDLGRIAELASLEVLWAAGCTDEALPAIGRLAGLRELYLLDETCILSLEPIAGLSALEFAYIHTESALADARPLHGMPRLRYLHLDAPGMRDLSSVAGLTQLNSLHLIPAPTVDSLAPLAALANLRYLSVWMEAVREGGLAPLAALRGLRSLEFGPHAFPLEEIVRLAVALPETEGPHRGPFLPPDDPAYDRPCGRCGRTDVYVAVGKRGRMLCPDCGAAAIRRHVVRWEVLLSAAASSSVG
jgi:hypothetical protein